MASNSADPMALTPAYLAVDKSGSVYAVLITFYVLASIAIVLRYISRLVVSKAGLGWDDYLITASYIVSCGIVVVTVISIKNGVGKHIEAVVTTQPKAISNFLKSLYAGDFIYFFMITLAKCSILAFYVRIFGDAIKKPVIVVTIFIGMWLVAVIVTTAVLCVPLAAFFNPTIHGSCINVKAFYEGNVIPNVITDFVILALPIPHIWKIQVPLAKKISIMICFIMGGFVCFVSAVRAYYTFHLDMKDLTYGLLHFVNWTIVEVYSAIICACLPSLQPLFRKVFREGLSKLSVGSDARKSTKQSGTKVSKAYVQQGEDQGSFLQLRDSQKGSSEGILQERPSNSEVELGDLEKGGGIIRQVQWETTRK